MRLHNLIIGLEDTSMELNFDLAEDEFPIFMAETDEQLQVLDDGLIRLEREGEDMELLQALFRAAHTLKGTAGMIGHKRMVTLPMPWKLPLIA